MRPRKLMLAGIPILLIGCGANTGTQPASTAAAPAAQKTAPSMPGSVPDRLRSAIATTLKIDESRVTPDASFVKDLGADELGMVELVMAYEREFKVDIRNADAERFKQVQDVVTYLQKHNALR